jgi:hypothetical protein
MAGPAGHLQWFHDTGELVLLGDIPRRGVAVEEIPVADTTAEDAELAVDEAADLLAGPLGGTGMVQGTTPETVEQTVLGSVVANDTRVAVLAVVEHGARVHALLWGWHRRHRRPEGWQWLLERLVHARGATRSG